MARILTNISLTRRKDIKIQLIHSFSFHIHNIWKANKLFAQETTAKFCQVSSFVIHHRGTIVTCNKLFLLLAKLNRCIDGKNFLKKSSVFFFFSFFFSRRVFRAYIFFFPLIHQAFSLLSLPMTRYPLELLFKSRK